jgi:hypothetical protein
LPPSSTRQLTGSQPGFFSQGHHNMTAESPANPSAGFDDHQIEDYLLRERTATGTSSTHPPAGFGKDINDYLLRHVTLADAKAGATSSLDFAVSGLLIASLPDGGAARFIALFAAGLLILSLLSGIAVIFPRTAVNPTGIIYWEGILTHKNVDDYLKTLAATDEARIEREYAQQNWIISKLLVDKFIWSQRGILLLLAGMLMALLSLALR